MSTNLPAFSLKHLAESCSDAIRICVVAQVSCSVEPYLLLGVLVNGFPDSVVSLLSPDLCCSGHDTVSFLRGTVDCFAALGKSDRVLVMVKTDGTKSASSGNPSLAAGTATYRSPVTTIAET